MERNMRAQRTLSKQATFEELDEVLDVPATKTGDGGKNTATDKTKNGDHNDKKEGKSNGVTTTTTQDDARKNGQPLSKMKLLQRSHAMREETSPPPDPESHRHQPAAAPAATTQPSPQKPPPNGNNNGNNNNNNNNNLSVRPPSRHKLSRQGSSRESTDSAASPCLSRENSSEQYTDFTGTDLEHFIMETINKNYKDRQLMLQIEQQLVSYVRQQPPLRQYYKFPAMSSYQRMLVHRVAAYFGMEHNVDQPGQCVVVSRTKGTRIPEVEFKEYIKEDLLFPEEPRRSILKRDSSSFEDGSFKSPERHFGSGECRRSKSFEEREEEYEKARKRIFTKGCDESGGNEGSYVSRRSSPDDVHWPGDIQPWSSSESDGRHRNNNNNNYLRADNRSANRLLKVESFEGGDTLKAGSLRMSVSKSYSFGGYSGSGSGRGDSNTGGSTRVLTKQDSGSSMSSRISPSSSGYKSQSQRSDATMSATPSPTATPHSHHPASTATGGDNTVMWAVTDMSAVPPGSLLINPQTGQPYTNADGSVYRHDPNNPFKCRAEESKSVSTQITPEASQPASPAKTRASGPQHAAITCPSKSTTTTSTSPSFPMTPPPVAVPPPAAPPPMVSADPSPATYAGLYKTFSQADPSPAANQMNPSQQAYVPAIYPMQQPQADPSQMYANPPLQCHNAVQSGPVVYTGYNMNHSYDRPTVPADLAMTELGGYFMGMSLVSDQQRGAGDAGSGQPQQHAYQQQQPAQPGPYWPAQQPAASMPMYYTMPHPGAGPLLTSSPPHAVPSSVNQASPRYVTYTSAYQAQPDVRQQPTHNGNYMATSGYQVPSYGAPMATGPPLMAPNGDCMMYAPPPPQSYYQPAPPQYAPAQQQAQPTASSYRAPTPPQTPTHSQPMCGPSFVYLNGGPAYPPVQYSGGPTASGAGPSPPGLTQYLPVLPNVGLFRPNMQIMQSSPPPRPPRDGGSGSKPPYSRSPSLGSNKDQQQRHYENGADKVAPRYPTTVPMFRMMAGRWRTPGDARSLVGSPLQGGLRMQFPLPPHHPNHRGPAQHFTPDSRAPRKPRPKGIMNLSLSNQLRGPHQPSPHHLGSFGGSHDTGRSPPLTHGSGLPSKHH